MSRPQAPLYVSVPFRTMQALIVRGRSMQDYQRDFLKFALDLGVLRFGQFTLKSGRVSPYFFNAGLFNSGAALAQLGRFYAQTIANAGLGFDLLYGPAYKGIPLATVTAAALYEHHLMDVPYAFNRKEAKAHGEGGQIVGHALEGNVLIIDDVITAGTAIQESMQLITSEGARPAGVVIALDRQERGASGRSAIQEIEVAYGIPVVAIARLEDLIEFIDPDGPTAEYLGAIQAYRQEYGI